MRFFNKIDIDFASFFKRGIKKKEEPFGCFLINGYMGSGKTYLGVYLTCKFNSNYNYHIKTNIHSLNIPKMNIDYFTSLEEIYNDNEEYCIYLIDELGKKYTKEAKADKDFYNFLQMSRKTKRIVMIIHQEYLQVPFWLRGVCEEVFTTKRVMFLPLFVTYRGYASLDPVTLEWGVDYTFRYIYKRNKQIASFYNTFETVSTL